MAARARLAPHLSYKTALALLPPAAIAPPIEAIRRSHDKNFARWPPHINLIYPFLASPSETDPAVQQGDEADEGVSASPQLKQDIHVRIQKAVKSIQPFRISFTANPSGTFSHGPKSRTVWLGPSGESVQQLQAALQAEFSECDADKRAFVPHLSVGQANRDEGAQNLAKKIKKSVADFISSSTEDAPVALEWSIDTVFVIERKGYHDRFKVIGAIELGKE